MVDGEIVRPWGRTVSYAQSLNLSISRPLNLSISYSQAKKANLFFERY